jgi:molybdopterin synthase sulfur carrier subunit
MITVKYFGAIAEQTGSQVEKISFSKISLSDLLAVLEQKYQLNNRTFTVAVNQKMVENPGNYLLESEDVIALLPPFAGG